MISFIVPGEPVLFAGSGSKDEFRVPPLAGPIEVTIRAEYVILKSWPEKKKEVAVRKTTKRDADKIIKLCLEAMTKIVFADDAQVVSLSLKKVYGPHARLFVSARELSRGDCALAGLLWIRRQP